ncbi:MAG TPA: hypothetical protein VF723_06715 [Pyrinomonadaceae bacterium]
MRNKLIPVALVAALLGGTVGAFVTHSSKTADGQTASTSKNFDNPFDQQAASNNRVADNAGTSDVTLATNNAGGSEDQSSYRTGFLDGFLAARDRGLTQSTARNAVVERTAAVAPQRVVYRPARRQYARSDNSRRVYYDYNNQPAKRSFWQKHRDKLTVAAGTGGGALLGALIGGKKGAAIGAIGGGVGSAVYTYGIRKRNRNY